MKQFIFVVTTICLVGGPAMCDEKQPVTRIVELMQVQPNNFSGSANLGKFDPGEIANARIVLQNPLHTPIDLSDVKSSCGCLSAKIENSEIPAMGETGIDVRIEIPKNSNEVQGSQLLSFGGIEPNKTRLTLKVQFAIRGLLAIPTESVVLNIHDSQKDKTIEFVSIVISDPVEAKNLTFEGDFSLDLLDIEIVTQADGVKLRIGAEPGLIPDDGLVALLKEVGS